MHTDAFLLLTTRFLSGEVSVEEGDRLNQLLENPGLKTQFIELQRRWDAAQADRIGDFEMKSAVKRLADGIREQQRSSPTQAIHPKKPKSTKTASRRG